MRVIGGSYRRRLLKTPTWPGLRPTSDRLRETLFNVLGGRIEGARVLDGYAGTGAIGIEALSRGAAHVTFVERDPRAIRLIRENLEHLGVTERYAIIRAAFSDPAAVIAGPFDVVVLDPPYADAPDAALARAARLIASDGVLVLEHARRGAVPETLPGLCRTRTIAAGDSGLSMYAPLGVSP